ncbi:MAG: hypothetical protein KKB31_06995 [Nanoarchaeota archaeon]|nr:hypothetical protein [Nanoarchaeota archaeon]
MPTEQFKKQREESDFRRGVFQATLVSSVNDKTYKFPTIDEYILSEFVNGVINFVGGNAGEVIYPQFDRIASDRYFEIPIREYFDKEVTLDKKEKLSQRIARAVDQLLKVEGRWDAENKPYDDVDLYLHFKGRRFTGICHEVMRSSFSLPQEVLIKVKNEIMPGLSEAEARDVVGIGQAMRPFIEQDLDYISKKYHW